MTCHASPEHRCEAGSERHGPRTSSGIARIQSPGSPQQVRLDVHRIAVTTYVGMRICRADYLGIPTAIEGGRRGIPHRWEHVFGSTRQRRISSKMADKNRYTRIGLASHTNVLPLPTTTNLCIARRSLSVAGTVRFLYSEDHVK